MSEHDDRFEHPERWTYYGVQVLNIWPHPDGKYVTVTYGGNQEVCMCASICSIRCEHLVYHAPDPWDGVELPEVILRGGGDFEWVPPTRYFMPKHLPPRRFRLIPLDEGRTDG